MQTREALQRWGWSSYFEALWNEGERGSAVPARVIAQQRKFWRIAGAFGECWGEASGKLRLAAEEGGDRRDLIAHIIMGERRGGRSGPHKEGCCDQPHRGPRLATQRLHRRSHGQGTARDGIRVVVKPHSVKEVMDPCHRKKELWCRRLACTTQPRRLHHNLICRRDVR